MKHVMVGVIILLASGAPLAIAQTQFGRGWLRRAMAWGLVGFGLFMMAIGLMVASS